MRKQPAPTQQANKAIINDVPCIPPRTSPRGRDPNHLGPEKLLRGVPFDFRNSPRIFDGRGNDIFIDIIKHSAAPLKEKMSPKFADEMTHICQT